MVVCFIYLRVNNPDYSQNQDNPEGGSVLRFKFGARGHPAITAKHPTTFEFTKDREMTREGDCIVAVESGCGLDELPGEIARAMTSTSAVMTVSIGCNGVVDVVRGHGNPGLTYTSPTEMVGRRSGYVCGRTLMVGADKAASDLSRELVMELREGDRVDVVLEVYPG